MFSLKKENQKFLSIYFIIGCTLLFAMARVGSFCDEYDVMSGAWLISKGWILYTDVFSHHMPFPYYFMSLFNIIGVHSTLGLRYCFTIVISVFFFFVFMHFGKKINKNIIGISFILYAILAPFFWGQQMLADSFLAMSCLILFLEVYTNNQLEFTVKDQIIISLATFTAITSTLIAIYPIFIFYFYYMINRIIIYFREKKMLRKYFVHDLKFIGIVLIPFMIWLTYMLVTGSFNDFISYGIKFNTNYYSQFTGEDTPITLVINHIKNIPKYFIWFLEYLFSMNSANLLDSTNIFIQGMRIVFYCFLFKCLRDNRYKEGVFLTIFTFFCYMRGDGFHGVSFYIICIFILSIFIFEGYRRVKKNLWTIKNILVYTILIILMSKVFYNYASYVVNEQKVITSDEISEVVRAVTVNDDYIWSAPLAPQLYITTERLPANKNIFYLPWQSKVPNFNQNIIDDLKEKQPKLIYYNNKDIIWGYPISEYGKDIYSYIVDNYFTLALNPNIYFNNNNKQEILDALNKGGYEILIEGYKQEESNSNLGNIIGSKIEQEILADKNNLTAIDVFVATYTRSNQEGTLHFDLTDENGKSIAQQDYNMEEITDNSKIRFGFNNIQNSAHRKFTLTLTFESYNKENMLTFYTSEKNIINELSLKVEGLDVDKDLYFTTYYRP